MKENSRSISTFAYILCYLFTSKTHKVTFVLVFMEI